MKQNNILKKFFLCWTLAYLHTPFAISAKESPEVSDIGPDLSKEKVLYVVGYAHLDTQWLWTYKVTIDEYLKNTLDENFALFETFPDYNFNFTGSIRYEMMQEYYPKKFAKLKEYIKAGRWFVSGSSVDEGDVNVPSAEAMFRQILLGNNYFRKEFGKESLDYMLPDCFGFPASMPSIWAHAGIIGFSTQKLTWGSAVGIPFNVGVWEGPDGKSVIAALNPGEYVGRVHRPLNTDSTWIKRVNANGLKYGIFADYHYYGVGDRGGAPRVSDVKNVMASLKNNGSIQVKTASSDQMYKDIGTELKQRLPRYKGDLLLTEHSAGTLTSKAFMKRWNKKNEVLADAAERLAVNASWLGAMNYPQEKINRAWNRVLGSQMHDILPGTSIPKAYEYSYNDEIVALNGFSEVLKEAMSGVSRIIDTSAMKRPILVYNPVSLERDDLVEATIKFPEGSPPFIKILNQAGFAVPSQIVSRTSNSLGIIFLAHVPSVGIAAFDIIATSENKEEHSKVKIDQQKLENSEYLVELNNAGDIISIKDKKAGNRELLRAPMRLEFQYEKPNAFPAWNMDWKDRQKPPYAYVDGPPTFKVLEKGPLRISLEITRKAQGSKFTQRIKLTEGIHQIEFDTSIDWLTTNSSLKASFPLQVSNPQATYNWGLGTIQRGNNEAKKYEVPSHEWFDLSDENGSYGVSVLSEAKYGSDKPDDSTLRLTLLYSPNTESGGYHWEATQDWGRHDFKYALYGHEGNWREADSTWQGMNYNQGLIPFTTEPKSGKLGHQISFAQLDTKQVAIKALKKAESSNNIIIRLQELWGASARKVHLKFLRKIVNFQEMDGQERPIDSEHPISLENGQLVFDIEKYSPKTIAIQLEAYEAELAKPTSFPIALNYNIDVISTDDKKSDGSMDHTGSSYPSEQFPRNVVSEGILFELGSTLPGQKNAMTASGQSIPLPEGDFTHIYLLAAADTDTDGDFYIDNQQTHLRIQKWFGKIGDFDTRIWGENHLVKHITPGFIKRTPIAWFASHRHLANGRNDSYIFSYLFKYSLKLEKNAHTLRLPNDPRIKIFAISAANNPNSGVSPSRALYDDFTNRKVIQPN